MTIEAADPEEDVIHMRDAAGDVSLKNLNLSGGDRGIQANKEGGRRRWLTHVAAGQRALGYRRRLESG